MAKKNVVDSRKKRERGLKWGREEKDGGKKKGRKEERKKGRKEGRTKSGEDHEISVVNRKSRENHSGEVDLTPVKEAIPLRRTSASLARTT